MVKTGEAFSEHIILNHYQKRQWGDSKQNPRIYFLPIIFVIIFAVLSLRIFYLQVIKGNYYNLLSDENRTKTVLIHAPRGVIFDRNNIPLVFNMPGFKENIKDKAVFLDQQMALSLIAQGKKDLEITTLRNYPYKNVTAHILGYLGQISPNELNNPIFESYNATDFIGKDGIEQEYEQKLKGIDGKQLFEINATGNIIRKLGQDEPIAGENITLTLDIKLQEKVYESMKNVKKGVVIVSTPKGEILSMVSKPSFDPNFFTLGGEYKSSSESGYLTLDSILNDSQNQPLLNRAIAGVYPPGSTFKIVVASAALKNKVIDENYTVEDTGVLKVGNFSFANWYYTGYGGKEGEVNVVKGIKRSNDIFFYQLAAKTGIDLISNTAKKFGIGTKLGIDLNGEKPGVLPTAEWKEKNIGEQWYLGDTYHYGIGQGFLLTTPLQVNGWTQAIANEGTLYLPHLLKSQAPSIKSQNLLDTKSFNLIRQGMIESCSTGGVGWPLFNFKVTNSKLKIDGKNILEVPLSSDSADMRQIVIACKTGTAEQGDAQALPHAWITLFAPAFNPQIIVTVLAEESGEGSNIAAPIAKKILEEYFSN